MRITIVQAHPDQLERHFGHALAEAYAADARENGHEIDTIDVARLDFPLLRSKREHRQRKALAGRSARVVVTMAMPAVVYRSYFRPHLDINTLSLSGLKPVRETLIGRVEGPGDEHRKLWTERVRMLGRSAG